VPWDPAFRFERPFDHFAFEAGAAFTAHPDATLRVRGLVAGKELEGDRWRGAWGLFGQFDLDTPGVFRVATTGLGIGITVGAPLRHGLALEGTAILAGVPMGAVGGIEPRGPEQRDYRLGLGAQSTVDLRLVAADRASLRLGTRQHLVFGADGAGRELIGNTTVAALVRVAGRHGAGVEAALATRSAPEGAGRDRTGQRVSVFYVVGGLSAPSASTDREVDAPSGAEGPAALTGTGR
jgi:hypothetical protein